VSDYVWDVEQNKKPPRAEARRLIVKYSFFSDYGKA
jgi:hypothetical protein